MWWWHARTVFVFIFVLNLFVCPLFLSGCCWVFRFHCLCLVRLSCLGMASRADHLVCFCVLRCPCGLSLGSLGFFPLLWPISAAVSFRFQCVHGGRVRQFMCAVRSRIFLSRRCVPASFGHVFCQGNCHPNVDIIQSCPSLTHLAPFWHLCLCVRVCMFTLQASCLHCRVRSGLPVTRRPWRCPLFVQPGAYMSQY